jgi:serine/threonine protein kinase
VYYGVHSETSKAVAIKVRQTHPRPIRRSHSVRDSQVIAISKVKEQDMSQNVRREISILKMIRHKNVVGLIEVMRTRTHIFLVLEYVVGGELFEKIVEEGKFNEDMARFYFIQLMDGVEYIHTLGICHRDLKVSLIEDLKI